MQQIKLNSPLKFVNVNNEEFSLGTEFVYELPKFLLDFEGLYVVLSLLENNVINYDLDYFFASYIQDAKFNKKYIIKQIEESIAKFDDALKVKSVTTKEDAYLMDATSKIEIGYTR